MWPNWPSCWHQCTQLIHSYAVTPPNFCCGQACSITLSSISLPLLSMGQLKLPLLLSYCSTYRVSPVVMGKFVAVNIGYYPFPLVLETLEWFGKPLQNAENYRPVSLT